MNGLRNPDTSGTPPGAGPNLLVPAGTHACSVEETERYRSIVDRAIVGVVQADADGRMRFVNRHWCDMLGYTEDELLGRHLVDVTDPSCVRAALEAIARLAAGGPDFVIDKRYLRKDGSVLHATSSVNAVRDADGRYLGLTAMVVDITRKVRAEAMQAGLHRALELVARAAPLAQTLDELVRAAEQRSDDGLLGSVLLVDDGHLRTVAAPSLPPPLQAALESLALPADAVDVGLRDPRWRPLRHAALAHGLHACRVLPVPGRDGRLLAAFVLYYRHRCTAQRDDEALVALVARTAALAIERARDEHALRESGERLRVALDTGGMGDWTLDLRTLELRGNALCKAHYGLPADAELGYRRVVRDLVHPDDRKALVGAVRDALRHHRGLELEYRALWPDGSVHWILTRGRVVVDASGRATHLAGVCLDMTARRSAEEALRQSEQQLRRSEARFRTMADVTPAMLWSALPDGSMLYASERWHAYTGIGRDSPVDWQNVVHPDDIGRAGREWARSIAQRCDYETEMRLRRHDGTFRWFLVRATPVRDADGQVACWFGSSTDIDDRRRAEQRLRLSEQRAQQAMDLADVCTWAWDVRTDTIAGDARWRALVGLDHPGPIALERIARRIHPDDWPRVHDALDAARDPAGDGRLAEEFRWVHRGGGTRWAMLRGQMLFVERDAGRHPLRLVGAALDVTERREQENALREADRRKDEFLAMLAHELRNPLAPLRNSLHLLRMELPEADRRRLHGVMERQVAQLVRLVDDLLEVSRITRGKIALHHERVLLADVVADAVETSRPLVDAAHHLLTVDLPDAPIAFEADPIRLSQVLANLLNNAAKYTEPGGHIALSARREGGSVVLRVRDDGMGIAPEQLHHVFDLFAQADRSLHRAQGGLGIGLTLVRSLVELHGGSVSAYSEGIGKGSTFEVRLPLHDDAPSGVESAGEVGGGGASCRVLVVDDNREHTETLAMSLRFAGHEVRCAYSGEEGLALAREFMPDAVLLDVGMPGMDGFEAARRLRELLGGERLLVAVTGWGQDDDRRRSREAGFDAHLVKPVDPEALLALVDSLCRVRQAGQGGELRH